MPEIVKEKVNLRTRSNRNLYIILELFTTTYINIDEEFCPHLMYDPYPKSNHYTRPRPPSNSSHIFIT
jgi:hypothetical protein